MGSKRRFRGFSLAELAVVIFILGMLAAIAAPRVANTIRRQRLDNASRRLMVDLELVRSQAILDAADRTLTLSLAGQYYTLPTQVRAASECQVNLNVTPYEGVTLAATSYDPAQVTFNRLGLPQAAGSITLQSGSETAIITISSTSGRPTRTFGS